MVSHHLVFVLVVVSVFARPIGFVAVSAAGIVTRELSDGVTETIRLLRNKDGKKADKRNDVNLTGANCASICGGVAGSGPNQANCNQIIDALNAQNTATFTVNPYSVASWIQASCTIEFIQSTADTVTYTYDYLGTVASHLSKTCNAVNGYAEGRCIFDGREDAIWVGNTAISGQSV